MVKDSGQIKDLGGSHCGTPRVESAPGEGGEGEREEGRKGGGAEADEGDPEILSCRMPSHQKTVTVTATVAAINTKKNQDPRSASSSANPPPTETWKQSASFSSPLT